MSSAVSFSGLDPYKLSGIQLTAKKLGSGAYASVYELDYLGLKCAGKKIHEVLLEQGGGATYALSRFAEECRLLSQMRHPNIVQFLGVYFETGMQVPVLVMEFLPSTLTSCIEKNGILRSEIGYSILHDVSLGLNYLHSHVPLIVHRDLSSNNVLLDSNMKAKIADLGVAKILNLTPHQVSRVVRNTQAPGTATYMPPEALIPNPVYNTSIDIFSLGIMIIHVLSGDWPEPEGVQIRMEHGTMIPVSEAERREKFLQAIGNKHPLMKLIQKCIDNDPAERPHIKNIVPQIKVMVAQNPPLFSNQLEMLHQIDVEREDKIKALKSIQRITSLESKHQKDKQNGMIYIACTNY